jgi:hypothetical protein
MDDDQIEEGERTLNIYNLILLFSLLVFIGVIAVVLGAAVSSENGITEDNVNNTLHKMMEDYNTDDENKKGWNTLQTELNCCGVGGSDDWLQYNMSLPDSCNKNDQTSGCLLPFIEHVEAYVQNTKNWSIAALALLSISCASILCTIVYVNVPDKY